MASRYFCLICRNPIPSPGAECPHCKDRATTSNGATPQLLAAVFLVMIALFVGTGYLNGAFNRERDRRSEEHFRIARTLADYGYYDQAIENYRDALLHRRNDFDYRLGLALALYYSDRGQEADPQLRELRAVDPTHARVNSLLARLARRDRRIGEAVTYYRTAIYGRWERDPEENRIETRFELVDFLLEEGRNREVVNELLSLLREEAGKDRVARRAGLLFEEAGAPAEAIRVLEVEVESGRADQIVYLALGRARFVTADYGRARLSLAEALRRGVDDDGDTERLYALAGRIVELDPAYRRVQTSEARLSPRDRYQRSRAVVERTLHYLENCIRPAGHQFVGPPAPLPVDLTDFLAAAREESTSKIRPAEYSEATAHNATLALELWARRSLVCTNIWDEDEPLAHVLEKAAR